jgi:hypothetical protein
MVRECLMSEELAIEWAEHFRGKTKEELDELAKSFAFGECWGAAAASALAAGADKPDAVGFTENCVQRKELNEILRGSE